MEGARDLALEMAQRGKAKAAGSSLIIRITRTRITLPPDREIWQQTSGPYPLCSCMGTTGTITGVSRFLREQEKRSLSLPTAGRGEYFPGIRRWPGGIYAGAF